MPLCTSHGPGKRRPFQTSAAGRSETTSGSPEVVIAPLLTSLTSGTSSARPWVSCPSKSPSTSVRATASAGASGKPAFCSNCVENCLSSAAEKRSGGAWRQTSFHWAVSGQPIGQPILFDARPASTAFIRKSSHQCRFPAQAAQNQWQQPQQYRQHTQ